MGGKKVCVRGRQAYLPASQILHAPGYLKAPADQVLRVDWPETILVVPAVTIAPLMVSLHQISIFVCVKPQNVQIILCL